MLDWKLITCRTNYPAFLKTEKKMENYVGEYSMFGWCCVSFTSMSQVFHEIIENWPLEDLADIPHD